MNSNNFIEAYFDGACLPLNPTGYMGAGVYIVDGQDTVRISHGYDRNYNNSNNVAEYKAINILLNELISKKHRVIRIFGDSMLVVQQLDGKMKVKAGRYVEEYHLAKDLLKELRKNNIVTLQWVPRLKNSIADSLSKEGANQVMNSKIRNN